jgi:hypothetical protein
MNTELEQKLVAAYPKNFGNYGKSPMESCMSWGLECGDGWYEIIDDLCFALNNSRWSTYEKGRDGSYIKITMPRVVFDQIKEKFGTLTIYFHTEYTTHDGDFSENGSFADPVSAKASQQLYNEQVEGMIAMAETLSERTCEICGSKEATQTKGGWIKTLCKSCTKRE